MRTFWMCMTMVLLLVPWRAGAEEIGDDGLTPEERGFKPPTPDDIKRRGVHWLQGASEDNAEVLRAKAAELEDRAAKQRKLGNTPEAEALEEAAQKLRDAADKEHLADEERERQWQRRRNVIKMLQQLVDRFGKGWWTKPFSKALDLIKKMMEGQIKRRQQIKDFTRAAEDFADEVESGKWDGTKFVKNLPESPYTPKDSSSSPGSPVQNMMTAPGLGIDFGPATTPGNGGTRPGGGAGTSSPGQGHPGGGKTDYEREIVNPHLITP